MSLNHDKSYNQQIRAWLKRNFEYSAVLSRQALELRDCPVCGAPGFSHFANNGYFDFVRCNECALVYMNPTLNPAGVWRGFQGEDQLLMDYFKIIQQFKSALPVEIPDPLQDGKLKDIYRYKPHGSLLDIGCSVGDFLHKAKHFYQVEGVEVNPATSVVAARHFKVHKDYLNNLISADSAAFSKRYDIVSMNQVLYGVPDPVGLLKDIHVVLKDDGIVYINTPNADSFAMQLYKGKTNHLYGYTTQNVFNRKALEKLALQSGFGVSFFRTEWLDIYYRDIMFLLEDEANFIHKRNSHLPDYEEHIASEDALQSALKLDLGDHGNYIVAILAKC